MILTKEQLHEALVERGGVTEEQFQEAANAREAAEVGIDRVLVSKGFLGDDQVGKLVAWYLGARFANLREESVSEEIVQLIPEAFARAKKLIPIEEQNGKIVIATADPKNLLLKSLLEKYVRREVEFVYATPRDLQDHLYLFRRNLSVVLKEILEKRRTAGIDTSIVTVVDTILDFAYQAGASDIHIEPEDDYMVVRYRVDGVLSDVAELPIGVHESVITRLKVMGRLATDEHRAAQDGKIVYKNTYGDSIEIRLSIVPTTHHEKSVMRLLSDKSRRFSMADLGLHEDDYKKISELIHRPWGMILVTGPTGSGKTTTLYSVLKSLNKRGVNITTIEDPVEYDIEGVNQIQVNDKTNLTFAKGLRSIVRQDPDIIMVGEVRDKETAGISVNAAMTGHLVLSSLHTNDAATAFPRLVDMEVEDFLIASTINVVIAQRLVRKVCMSCIHSTSLNTVETQIVEHNPQVKKYLQEISKKKDLKKLQIYKGKGCTVCNNTGYHGRVGVFELLLVSDAVREAIMDHKNADEIHDIAVKEGMTTMLYDGLRKMLTGVTSLEEVMRVIRE
jgi:type IV pilus assembly protein PilB